MISEILLEQNLKNKEYEEIIESTTYDFISSLATASLAPLTESARENELESARNSLLKAYLYLPAAQAEMLAESILYVINEEKGLVGNAIDKFNSGVDKAKEAGKKVVNKMTATAQALFNKLPEGAQSWLKEKAESMLAWVKKQIVKIFESFGKFKEKITNQLTKGVAKLCGDTKTNESKYYTEPMITESKLDLGIDNSKNQLTKIIEKLVSAGKTDFLEVLISATAEFKISNPNIMIYGDGLFDIAKMVAKNSNINALTQVTIPDPADSTQSKTHKIEFNSGDNLDDIYVSYFTDNKVPQKIVEQIIAAGNSEVLKNINDLQSATEAERCLCDGTLTGDLLKHLGADPLINRIIAKLGLEGTALGTILKGVENKKVNIAMAILAILGNIAGMGAAGATAATGASVGMLSTTALSSGISLLTGPYIVGLVGMYMLPLITQFILDYGTERGWEESTLKFWANINSIVKMLSFLKSIYNIFAIFSDGIPSTGELVKDLVNTDDNQSLVAMNAELKTLWDTKTGEGLDLTKFIDVDELTSASIEDKKTFVSLLKGTTGLAGNELQSVVDGLEIDDKAKVATLLDYAKEKAMHSNGLFTMIDDIDENLAIDLDKEAFADMAKELSQENQETLKGFLTRGAEPETVLSFLNENDIDENSTAAKTLIAATNHALVEAHEQFFADFKKLGFSEETLVKISSSYSWKLSDFITDGATLEEMQKFYNETGDLGLTEEEYQKIVDAAVEKAKSIDDTLGILGTTEGVKIKDIQNVLSDARIDAMYDALGNDDAEMAKLSKILSNGNTSDTELNTYFKEMKDKGFEFDSFEKEDIVSHVKELGLLKDGLTKELGISPEIAEKIISQDSDTAKELMGFKDGGSISTDKLEEYKKLMKGAGVSDDQIKTIIKDIKVVDVQDTTPSNTSFDKDAVSDDLALESPAFQGATPEAKAALLKGIEGNKFTSSAFLKMSNEQQMAFLKDIADDKMSPTAYGMIQNPDNYKIEDGKIIQTDNTLPGSQTAVEQSSSSIPQGSDELDKFQDAENKLKIETDKLNELKNAETAANTKAGLAAEELKKADEVITKATANLENAKENFVTEINSRIAGMAATITHDESPIKGFYEAADEEDKEAIAKIIYDIPGIKPDDINDEGTKYIFGELKKGFEALPTDDEQTFLEYLESQTTGDEPKIKLTTKWEWDTTDNNPLVKDINDAENAKAQALTAKEAADEDLVKARKNVTAQNSVVSDKQEIVNNAKEKVDNVSIAVHDEKVQEISKELADSKGYLKPITIKSDLIPENLETTTIELEAQIKLLDKDITDLNTKITEFNPLEGVTLDDLKEQKSNLEKMKESANLMKDSIDASYSSLNNVSEVLKNDDVKNILDVSNSNPYNDILGDTKEKYQNIVELKAKIATAIKEGASVDKIKDLSDDLTEALTKTYNLDVKNEVIETFKNKFDSGVFSDKPGHSILHNLFPAAEKNPENYKVLFDSFKGNIENVDKDTLFNYLSKPYDADTKEALTTALSTNNKIVETLTNTIINADKSAFSDIGKDLFPKVFESDSNKVLGALKNAISSEHFGSDAKGLLVKYTLNPNDTETKKLLKAAIIAAQKATA